ncbi:hypothetical protein ACIQ57_07235 [Lysinibacillus xylanilyticus]|uniref:hypothetical protein n=1 Tax=Lysinibacillus xylanilyticus TaxID=582475 RepID=UPI0037F27072
MYIVKDVTATKKHLLLIDTFIVPEVPGYLYALFDYGTFEHILNTAIDETQKDKIDFFINGFINIAQCETINEDFVLIFYDLLSELRLVDLTVLKLYGRYYIK